MIWNVADDVVSKKGEPSGLFLALMMKEPATKRTSRPTTTMVRGRGMCPVDVCMYVCANVDVYRVEVA